MHNPLKLVFPLGYWHEKGARWGPEELLLGDSGDGGGGVDVSQTSSGAAVDQTD
jgi:hypothetical protein